MTNIWSQKATFPGSGRYSSLSFYINGYGYVATGFDGNPKKDVWQYNPISDTWVQKNNFPGPPRQGANGFAIGDAGYILAGFNNGTSYNDFWKYDPINDLWVQKTNFPSIPRRAMSYFVINGTAYAGLGYDNTLFHNDFYSFDTTNNQWISETNFGGSARYLTFSFNINNSGYLGTGSNGQISSPNFLNDIWEFIPGSIGLDQNQDVFYQVWFNHENNSLNLELEVNAGRKCMINIFNQNGQVVSSGKINSIRENLEYKINANLSPGIYFYSILFSSNKRKTGKFLVK